jgi:hypothetical protein
LRDDSARWFERLGIRHFNTQVSRFLSKSSSP